jgi:hypothetical protein
MHEGDNPSFSDEFIKFTFFLTFSFIFVFLSKYRSMSDASTKGATAGA